MNNILEKHKAHFPEIESLYDYQNEVFARLEANKNVLAIIPTGGGKSLLYQLRALDLDGVTLVVSPLMALMDEQVNELNKRGIKSLALNANISLIKQRAFLRDLGKSDYKLIYISAERLQNPFFCTALIASAVKISLLVIDEAHCISQWGGSFRPDYGQIPSFISFLHKNDVAPQLLCLTATVAREARDEMIKEFTLNIDDIYISPNLIRNNLRLHFQKVQAEKEKENILRKFLEEKKPRKTIVYLYSKRKCEIYAKTFASQYSTNFFHADLNADQKALVYDDFLNSKIGLLFATTAFGMGINIPDIDSIVQLQIPHSIEEYYQQTGRGWRKKDVVKDCQCLLLWSDKNFKVRKKDLENQRYNADKIRDAYRSLVGFSKIKKVGQLVNKSKDSFLLSKDYNLQLLRYKLEKRHIIKFIGELNGTPLTIKFKQDTKLWTQIVDTATEGIDSFRYVCETLAISFTNLSSHLFEEDLKNNIKTLPAMIKDIYFEILKLDLPEDAVNSMALEMDREIDLRIAQIEELKSLCNAEDPYLFIQNKLNDD